MDYHVTPTDILQGEVHVPGDKSISHRSLLLGALAEGETFIEGFLQSKDTLATESILNALGVEIKAISDTERSIQGVGKHGLTGTTTPLYCGNSGTTMRLLCGILAAQAFSSTLTGDHSLSKRPMERVATPLRLMGAKIETTEEHAPVIIHPVRNLQGIHYRMSIASAQIKSAFLLASLYARDESKLTESMVTRDHTERMLRAFNYPIKVKEKTITLRGGYPLVGTHIKVPTDFSSAAFFIVAACISQKAEILLKEVGVNPTRTGLLDLLRQMGADISLENPQMFGDEPIADIRVRSSSLQGITISPQYVSRTIDEFPILFIAAANAQGETILTGAQELRVKESDRLATMAEGLNTLGVKTTLLQEGIKITGGKYTGGVVNSHGDHRIAMAFAIAAITAKEAITIQNCENVSTSFPNFVELAQVLGVPIK